MNILLIETETKGHHISSYLRSIVLNLKKKKINIFFLTSQEFKKHKLYNFFNIRTKIIFMKKVPYPKNKKKIDFVQFQLKYYNSIKYNFSKIHEKYNFNRVYVNTLDFFDKPLSIFGSPFKKVPFYGLYLNPKFHIGYSFFSIGFLKKYIYYALFKNLIKIKFLKKIFIVDLLFLNYLKKKKIIKKIYFQNEIGTANAIKYKFSKLNCKRKLNINSNDFVILVYGSIRENKCLKDLFCVTKLLYRENFRIKLIIAGQQDKDTKKSIDKFRKQNQNIKKNIIIFNEFIDDTKENILFGAANLTWIGYSKSFYGSSGVLFLSSQNHVPVIGSEHGLLGHQIKNFKIGYTSNLEDHNQTKNKIKKIICKKNGIKFHYEKANKKRNFENFGKAIVKKLNL